MPIKQSFCYGLFQGDLSLDALCKEAAAIGYSAVELWDWRRSPFDGLVAAAKNHGLRIVSLIGHRSLPDVLNKPENHDLIEAELLESIARCHRHDIPGMIVFSANRRDGVPVDQHIDSIVA